MSVRAKLAAMAAAILAGEHASPVSAAVDRAIRPTLSHIANTPTTKRAKTKAARKQRSKS
jgi:hypothetical protein